MRKCWISGAYVATRAAYRLTRSVRQQQSEGGFRLSQIASSSIYDWSAKLLTDMRDVRQQNLDRPSVPEIYYPVAQNWSQLSDLGMTLVVAARERADHEDLAREERERVGLADLHAELEVRGGE